MNSQQLLYINLGIGLFFVLYFLFFRSKPRPSVRLNLRAKSSEERQIGPIEVQRQEREAQAAQVVQEVLTKQSMPQDKALPKIQTESCNPLSEGEKQDATSTKSFQKDNSIYFVYNGHEWECHDVLGVQRGASLSEATEIYQRLIKTSDSSTFPFYEAAFEAILKRKGAK